MRIVCLFGILCIVLATAYGEDSKAASTADEKDEGDYVRGRVVYSPHDSRKVFIVGRPPPETEEDDGDFISGNVVYTPEELAQHERRRTAGRFDELRGILHPKQEGSNEKKDGDYVYGTVIHSPAELRQRPASNFDELRSILAKEPYQVSKGSFDELKKLLSEEIATHASGDQGNDLGNDEGNDEENDQGNDQENDHVNSQGSNQVNSQRNKNALPNVADIMSVAHNMLYLFNLVMEQSKNVGCFDDTTSEIQPNPADTGAMESVMTVADNMKEVGPRAAGSKEVKRSVSESGYHPDDEYTNEERNLRHDTVNKRFISPSVGSELENVGADGEPSPDEEWEFIQNDFDDLDDIRKRRSADTKYGTHGRRQRRSIVEQNVPLQPFESVQRSVITESGGLASRQRRSNLKNDRQSKDNKNFDLSHLSNEESDNNAQEHENFFIPTRLHEIGVARSSYVPVDSPEIDVDYFHSMGLIQKKVETDVQETEKSVVDSNVLNRAKRGSDMPPDFENLVPLTVDETNYDTRMKENKRNLLPIEIMQEPLKESVDTIKSLTKEAPKTIDIAKQEDRPTMIVPMKVVHKPFRSIVQMQEARHDSDYKPIFKEIFSVVEPSGIREEYVPDNTVPSTEEDHPSTIVAVEDVHEPISSIDQTEESENTEASVNVSVNVPETPTTDVESEISPNNIAESTDSVPVKESNGLPKELPDKEHSDVPVASKDIHNIIPTISTTTSVPTTEVTTPAGGYILPEAIVNKVGDLFPIVKKIAEGALGIPFPFSKKQDEKGNSAHNSPPIKVGDDTGLNAPPLIPSGFIEVPDLRKPMPPSIRRPIYWDHKMVAIHNVPSDDDSDLGNTHGGDHKRIPDRHVGKHRGGYDDIYTDDCDDDHYDEYDNNHGGYDKIHGGHDKNLGGYDDCDDDHYDEHDNNHGGYDDNHVDDCDDDQYDEYDKDHGGHDDKHTDDCYDDHNDGYDHNRGGYDQDLGGYDDYYGDDCDDDPYGPYDDYYDDDCNYDPYVIYHHRRHNGYGKIRGGYNKNYGSYGKHRGGYKVHGGFNRNHGGHDRNRGGYDKNRHGYDKNRNGNGRGNGVHGGFGNSRGGYHKDRGYNKNHGDYNNNRGNKHPDGYIKNRGGYDTNRGRPNENRAGYDKRYKDYNDNRKIGNGKGRNNGHDSYSGKGVKQDDPYVEYHEGHHGGPGDIHYKPHAASYNNLLPPVISESVKRGIDIVKGVVRKLPIIGGNKFGILAEANTSPPGGLPPNRRPLIPTLVPPHDSPLTPFRPTPAPPGDSPLSPFRPTPAPPRDSPLNPFKPTAAPPRDSPLNPFRPTFAPPHVLPPRFPPNSDKPKDLDEDTYWHKLEVPLFGLEHEAQIQPMRKLKNIFAPKPPGENLPKDETFSSVKLGPLSMRVGLGL